MPNDSTISIRLPEETRKTLDEVAARERRSRAFIVKEALERHFAMLRKRPSEAERKAAFQRIYALKGAGVRAGRKPMSPEEIDKLMREIRGD